MICCCNSFDFLQNPIEMCWGIHVLDWFDWIVFNCYPFGSSADPFVWNSVLRDSGAMNQAHIDAVCSFIFWRSIFGYILAIATAHVSVLPNAYRQCVVKIMPKWNRYRTTYHPKSTKMGSQIHPEWKKMEPILHQNAPGGCPRSLGQTGREKKRTPAESLMQLWSKNTNLGWFWPPFWHPGGPVGLPRSWFFDQILAWGSKNGFSERS